MKRIPMMPLSILNTSFPCRYVFQPVEQISKNYMRLELIITVQGKEGEEDEKKSFYGRGSNKNECKCSAAVRALKYFKIQLTTQEHPQNVAKAKKMDANSTATFVESP